VGEAGEVGAGEDASEAVAEEVQAGEGAEEDVGEALLARWCGWQEIAHEGLDAIRGIAGRRGGTVRSG